MIEIYFFAHKYFHRYLSTLYYIFYGLKVSNEFQYIFYLLSQYLIKYFSVFLI